MTFAQDESNNKKFIKIDLGNLLHWKIISEL